MAHWVQYCKILNLFYQSNNTGPINVKMDGSSLEEKPSFKMLALSFFSKLDWGSYIISIKKTASKKIGCLICSMKFFSEEALYLYKSTIRPGIKYCCHVCTGTPSCYLDKLQKRICTTAAPWLTASLEPLPSLSLFYRYYIGICLSELAQLVPLPYSQEYLLFL